MCFVRISFVYLVDQKTNEEDIKKAFIVQPASDRHWECCFVFNNVSFLRVVVVVFFLHVFHNLHGVCEK